MRPDGARTGEACRIVDAGLERQGDVRADGGRRHQQPARRVLAGGRDDPPVEDAPLLEELGPREQERLDDRQELSLTREPVAQLHLEARPAERQDDPVATQEAADDVLDPDQLVLDRVARGDQGAQALRRHRLHPHRAEGVRAHHRRDAAGVVLVVLVPEARLQRRGGMAGIDADRRPAPPHQPSLQPSRRRSDLQPDPLERVAHLIQELRDDFRVRPDLRLLHDLAVTVDGADGRLPQRHIQTAKVHGATSRSS